MHRYKGSTQSENYSSPLTPAEFCLRRASLDLNAASEMTSNRERALMIIAAVQQLVTHLSRHSNMEIEEKVYQRLLQHEEQSHSKPKLPEGWRGIVAEKAEEEVYNWEAAEMGPDFLGPKVAGGINSNRAILTPAGPLTFLVISTESSPGIELALTESQEVTLLRSLVGATKVSCSLVTQRGSQQVEVMSGTLTHKEEIPRDSSDSPTLEDSGVAGVWRFVTEDGEPMLKSPVGVTFTAIEAGRLLESKNPQA